MNPTMSLDFAHVAHPSQVGWWIGPQPHNDIAWLRKHGTVRALLGEEVLGSFTALGTGDVGGLDRVIHDLELRPERAPSPIPQGHPEAHPPTTGGGVASEETKNLTGHARKIGA